MVIRKVDGKEEVVMKFENALGWLQVVTGFGFRVKVMEGFSVAIGQDLMPVGYFSNNEGWVVI